MSRGSRGRRYEEPKLNMKKVFAVIIAILVVIMCIVMVNGILKKDNDSQTGKISSKSYFVSFKDNKWGVIDETGTDVIDPSYQEMIIIPNNKNDIFLCTYDVNYGTGEYKTKVLNSKNEEILTQYNRVEALQNKDINNNLWYEDNILKIENDGKYGLINFTGKEILKCEYDEIIALEGIKNAFRVKKDDKYGVFDSEGKEIVSIGYSQITPIGSDNKAGYIVKSVEGKYGVVGYSNTLILQSIYDNISRIHGNDTYFVTKDSKKQLIKKDGTLILDTGFDDIKAILKSEDNGFIYIKDNKYGVMKLTGEILVENIYEDLQEAKGGILIAKKDGKVGIIDLHKEQKVEFKYNTIQYNEKADIYIAENEQFKNDVLNNTFEVKQTGILTDIDTDKGFLAIRQNEETKYYNFKFEEKKESDIYTSNTLFLSRKDGKYGFVDKQGKVIVDYQYDDAISQNVYGYVAVNKDGKWGSIDSKGNVIIEPTYNLDEYLKIDFIGRWHYGKDINMKYYNQL